MIPPTLYCTGGELAKIQRTGQSSDLVSEVQTLSSFMAPYTVKGRELSPTGGLQTPGRVTGIAIPVSF